MHRALCVTILAASLAGCAVKPPPQPAILAKTSVDQGPRWTLATRAQFYRQDQGSKIMPIAWMKALRLPNGDPFLGDALARYGYLANDTDPASILPVGFTVTGPIGGEVVGMTCSACHTRQIEVSNVAYRIDGGPAIADFQGFLADLDTAVGAVIAQPAAFQQFQAAVLPQPAAQADQDTLMTEVQAWYLRYHTLISRALPPTPWGPSRLDAVAMIFDRLTGLDLGPPPSHLIPENVRVADAPVRYPFLWNAPIQDHTQWPAFAQNGNDVLALSRNLGEEFGVFGEFFPAKDASNLILHVDYRTQNSANFAGLESLEGLIKQIGPPAYPWKIDPVLAARGKAIYDAPTAQGGCAECHGIRPGEDRLTFSTTWATPAMDVGTDGREHDLLARTAQSGVLAGARIPFITSPLAATDTAFDLLATSVTGSILEPQLRDLTDSSHTMAMASGKASAATLAAVAAKPDVVQLGGAFTAPSTTVYKYESRVLQGIWATAPYLHNGSVPTLADLLKPAAQRPASFAVGPAYDKDALGLARTQTKFGYVLRTTDCSDRNSGNSRCGHEFGTTLPDADKTALLEYLKQL